MIGFPLMLNSIGHEYCTMDDSLLGTYRNHQIDLHYHWVFQMVIWLLNHTLCTREKIIILWGNLSKFNYGMHVLFSAHILNFFKSLMYILLCFWHAKLTPGTLLRSNGGSDENNKFDSLFVVSSYSVSAKHIFEKIKIDCKKTLFGPKCIRKWSRLLMRPRTLGFILYNLCL